MNRPIVLRLMLSLLLCVLYGWVLWLMLHPHVSEEYQRYYIAKEISDWRPAYYPARPEEGFDFAKPGLPAFVRFTAGLSGIEAWGGRWTDTRVYPVVKFYLQTPLQGNVCVRWKAMPSPSQLGQPVWVRLGSQQQAFTPDTREPRWYPLEFTLQQPESVLILDPTAAASPPGEYNRDLRKLGVGLHQLLIIQGSCHA